MRFEGIPGGLGLVQAPMGRARETGLAGSSLRSGTDQDTNHKDNRDEEHSILCSQSFQRES